jgi:hypothetical protein
MHRNPPIETMRGRTAISINTAHRFPQADLRRTVLVLTNRPTLGRRYDGLAVAARALGSNFAVLTFAEDFLSHNARVLKMNTGHCEQLSDCWSSEQQPATYYRTAAAQARRLQANATTPRVKQYFDKMIAHCERLAGKVEPGVSPARSATSGRAKRFIIGAEVVEIDEQELLIIGRCF